MSKEDAMEEYIKLYRLYIFLGIFSFAGFFYQLFSSLESQLKFGFTLFIVLLSFVGTIYGFIKFYEKVKELNKLKNQKYSIRFYFLKDADTRMVMLYVGLWFIIYL